MFLCNLGDSFVLLLVEPIARKNASPSDKQLWRFSKNVLGAEKSQCKVSSIVRHLEISSLLLMSAENTETLTFVSLKLCFLDFVRRHNELFFSYLWSFVNKFTSSGMNPIASRCGKNAHTFNYNRFKAEFFVYAEVYAFKVTSL